MKRDKLSTRAARRATIGRPPASFPHELPSRARTHIADWQHTSSSSSFSQPVGYTSTAPGWRQHGNRAACGDPNLGAFLSTSYGVLPWKVNQLSTRSARRVATRRHGDTEQFHITQFSDRTSVSTIWPLLSKAGSCSLASALVACQDCALGQHRQDMGARTQCWSIRAQAVHVGDLSRVGIGIGTTSREPSSRRYVIADLAPDDLTPDDTPSQPSWLRNFGVVLFHYCLLCRFHTPGSFDRMI